MEHGMIGRRLRQGLLLCGLCLAIGQAAMAQSDAPPPGQPEGGGPGMRGGMRGMNVDREVQHLTQVLSLNDSQQAQVKTILTEQKQQMDTLRSSAENSGDPSAFRDKARGIQSASEQKISAVLNDDQKAKYSAWLEQRKSRMHRGGDGQAPPSSPDGNGPSER